VAYLLVVRSELRFYGGLLITDALGQPAEFVHTTADSPSGFLWPPDEVRRVAVAKISHALFDSCQKSPTILIATDEIGSSEFCKEHIGSSIPFVLVAKDGSSNEIHVSPVGEAPSGAASAVLGELKRRKLLDEPFQRIRSALAEVYSELRVEVHQDGSG
jgi:hypothetical protein